MRIKVKHLLLAVGTMLCAHFASAGDQNAPRHYRGINVIWLDQKVLEEAALRWGANQVRYELIPRVWAGRLKCSEEEAWHKMMEDLPAGLDRAKKLGLQVVVDLHEAPNLDWKKPESCANLFRCWRDIVKICKDRPEDIWYDLLNEPLMYHPVNNAPIVPPAWPKIAQQLTDQIRKDDPKHWIVIEPGPGSFDWGFKDFPLIKGKRIIYSPHQYQPFAFTHQAIENGAFCDPEKRKTYKFRGWNEEFHSCGSPNTGPGVWSKKKIKEELAPVIAFQKKYNVPIWVGEFSGCPWAPGIEQCMKDNVELFEELGWSWCYHSLEENVCWSLDTNPDIHDPELFEKSMKILPPKAQMLLKYFALNGRPQHPDQYRCRPAK